MNPGDPNSAGELLIFDEQALSDPMEPAAHDDEFRAQQQRTERLNKYYNEVVAELRALLDPIPVDD